MKQQECKLDKEITKQVKLDYLLYLPVGYEETNREWPLILFLHGRGERGTDLSRLQQYGLPKLVEEQEDFPFIVVSPQCPLYTTWGLESDALLELLDDVSARYAVDRSRIYLTGISMGGFGTWNLATDDPTRFAAIAPICSTGPTEKVHMLKDVPVWVFHGAKDTTVPVHHAEEMVEKLKACGGNPRLTIYPDADHAGLTPVFFNMEIYDWFLQHRRKTSHFE
ncbi:prolyl oligopeptidase family serine peptidase [Paenibacillus sp. WQ 127069]|uniref:Prolyl oligopeptidase family serine peptidase n=1 Tax=Paenibacillus baimaensis TaxID=2982185 RepID=A0ABT2UU29_9BACL|nr:prolyl oligopeptidase family serine peptidase [Paenibacillus sp. WQ 127069]MCU6798120.1 prolyl oligopeptidase family serine peptidase [Paenibacillus sp. WQ 127069]